MHDTTDEPYYYNLKRIKTEKLHPYDMLIAGSHVKPFQLLVERKASLMIEDRLYFT